MMQRNTSHKYGNSFTKKDKSLLRTRTICNASLAYHDGTSYMLQHFKKKHPSKNPVSFQVNKKQQSLNIFSRKCVCSTEQLIVYLL